MASIRDVAKEAGVSPATVSRTFATPGLINVQTQQRVLAAARRLDYRPPRLRTPRGPSVGLPMPVVAPRAQDRPASHSAIGFQFFSATDSPYDNVASNDFYAPVLFGAQAEAARLGMYLLLHNTNRHSVITEGGLPRMIEERAVGGLLLVGTADRDVLDAFATRVPRIILVDNHDETDTYESVISDGFTGAMLATRHLLALGHRQIGFYLTEEGVMSFRDRLRGYRCALIEAGIAPNPTWIVGVGSLNDQMNYTQAAQRMRRDDRPTAVLAANDDSARGLLRVCREIGLTVPKDVSLIGFDDTPIARTVDPPLTTVRVDKEAMGRLAVRRLNECIWSTEESAPRPAYGIASPPVRHVIPVSLVHRESCQPPHG